MPTKLSSINKKEHHAICSKYTFTMGAIWYSSAHFLPEPKDPILLAIYDQETSEISFHIGYAEWDSPFAPYEFHEFDEKKRDRTEIKWISQTMKEGKEFAKIVAFAPMIHFWRGIANTLKVGSQYTVCKSKVDENECYLPSIEQRKHDSTDEFIQVAKLFQTGGSLISLILKKSLKRINQLLP